MGLLPGFLLSFIASALAFNLSLYAASTQASSRIIILPTQAEFVSLAAGTVTKLAVNATINSQPNYGMGVVSIHHS